MSRGTWTHLRVSATALDVRKGLEARLADPLWTLARQWQLGEFDGDDAASPVKVAVSHVSLKVGRLSAPDADTDHPIPDDALIEPIIEAIPAEVGPATLRMRGEAALQLLRMIENRKNRAEFRDAMQGDYPLSLPDDAPPMLRYIATGSFDARALLRALPDADNPEVRAEALADLLPLENKPALSIAARWLGYVDHRFAGQVDTGLWRADRLEYHASLSAKRGAAEITLAVPGHPGGELDWHAFNVDATKETSTELPRPKTDWLLPTPIAYSGMPADRFWDFEDGEVYFGGLTLEETDLAQIVLAEFATVYSNDWFMIPIPVDTGTLTRITKLELHDSFGETHTIEACAVCDPGDDPPWRFFEMAGDGSAEAGFAPWLYIPRATSGGDTSRPVEKVMLRRDDAANLGWGIEQVVEDVTGAGRDRDQHWKRVRDAYPHYTGAGDAPPPENGAWSYRLLTTAPPHWVPFMPQRDANDVVTGKLVRARMGEWSLLGEDAPGLAGPQGRIMDPMAPMLIEEEELMRGGIDVVRRYQSARGPDGRLIIWAGNAKAPAKGETSSGRMTDVVRTGRKGGTVT